jgi:hypothetical protein
MDTHVAALTPAVAGIATAGMVDCERLEELANLIVNVLRLGARPVSSLQVESRKNRP